jgi:hypothetical protein
LPKGKTEIKGFIELFEGIGADGKATLRKARLKAKTRKPNEPLLTVRPTKDLLVFL